MRNTVIQTEPRTFLIREALAWYFYNRHCLPVLYTPEMIERYGKSLSDFNITKKLVFEHSLDCEFNLN